MTRPTVPLPGDPTVPQQAAADQRHAATKHMLDRLVAATTQQILQPGYDPNDVAVWANTALSGCIDAAFDMTPPEDSDPTPALAGLLAEAVLRLAQWESR